MERRAGIDECPARFGTTIVNSGGRHLPVREIGEQHVTEDCGWIPSVCDWLRHIEPQPWMRRVSMKSKELVDGDVQQSARLAIDTAK